MTLECVLKSGTVIFPALFPLLGIVWYPGILWFLQSDFSAKIYKVEQNTEPKQDFCVKEFLNNSHGKYLSKEMCVLSLLGVYLSSLGFIVWKLLMTV